MKKESLILWISSFVITFLAIYYSTVTDLSYPISGKIAIDGKNISYRFEKIHFGSDSVNIFILTDIKNLNGKIYFKNESEILWDSTNLKYSSYSWIADFPSLPAQNAANYYVEILYQNKIVRLPNKQSIQIKFYGNIPNTINVIYFLFFYLIIFLSNRIGLEYFNECRKTKIFIVVLVSILLPFTFLISPLYLSYKLGYINSSIPKLNQLFSCFNILITSLWIFTLIALFNFRNTKYLSAVSSIITLLLFLFYRYLFY